MKKTSLILTALLGLSAFSVQAEKITKVQSALSNATTAESDVKPRLTVKQRMNLAQDFANKQDWKSVFEIMQPLALEGNVQAQSNLAMMYNLGRGVPKDQEKAYWWFSEAAESGSINAINNLAVMYYNGGYVKKDIPQAIKLFETTAKAKDMDAMLMLGEIYFNQQDEEKSLYWVKKAADLGNSEATFRLGVYYEEGIGTSVNKRLAALIYREVLLSDSMPKALKEKAQERLFRL